MPAKKKAVEMTAFFYDLSGTTCVLLVLMPHLLFQFSVFVFPDLFFPLLHNASHAT